MRAALYARYSSDRQRETSIDDQVRLCRDRAERETWLVVDIFIDRALSAALPFASRPGAAALLELALAGGCDVVVIESLDRCFRDLLEQERIVRLLEFRGVRLVGVSDGYDSQFEDRELHRGFRGLLNQHYLRDLAKKVHRGLVGQVDRNLSAGGLPFGYRPIQRERGQDLEIDPTRAAHVREIFEMAAAGKSARAIAAELNRRRIPGPKGGTWAFSAIYGHPKKGTGILRNAIYIGRYTWNRTRWVKDPESGRRRRFERPPSEWLTRDRQDLRIIDDALWHAVRARLQHVERPRGGRSPRSPLSGLLRCQACGGAVIAVSKYDYGCATHKDRGPAVCDGIRVKRRTLESRILEIARAELAGADAIAQLRREVAAEMANQERESRKEIERTENRLRELERAIANLVDAAAAAPWSRALSDRLHQAEQEREQLHAIARTRAAGPRAILPRLLDKYCDMLADLPAAMARAPEEAREALSACFGTIRLSKQGRAIYAEIDALGAILTLVAGVGFEPTTFGL
jgi:site-specific DNA recombinase